MSSISRILLIEDVCIDLATGQDLGCVVQHSTEGWEA